MNNNEVEQILQHIATVHDLDGAILSTSDDHEAPMQPVTLPLEKWTVRLAARCIIVDKNSGRIALQHLETEDVTKIPGGGLQYTVVNADGESFMSGVSREIAEEVGINADDMQLRPLGLTIEYRTQWKMIQISYCYAGEVEGENHGEPLEDGSHLVWADTVGHALDLIHSYEADTYDKSFMQARDRALIKYFMQQAV